MDAATALGVLGLTGQSFRSFSEATRAVLELLERQLPTSVVWVGHLDHECRTLRVVDARGVASIPITAGSEAPLETSLCHVMASGRGSALCTDATTDPVYSRLEIQQALDVGSFVGVPLELGNGMRIGTLCAVAHELGAYDDEHLTLLSVMVVLLEYELEGEHRERELVALTERLRDQARTDPLTGLANRRVFDEALAREWSLARRGTHPAWIVLADLDGLKQINDRQDHLAGDAALLAAARALRTSARDTDVVARLGGDEFAVLLAGCADRDEADRFVARVGARLADEAAPAGPLRLSSGLAPLAAADTAAGALQAADAAMYADKRRSASS